MRSRLRRSEKLRLRRRSFRPVLIRTGMWRVVFCKRLFSERSRGEIPLKSFISYLSFAFLATAVGLESVPYVRAQNTSTPLSFEVAAVKVAAAGPNGIRGGCHGITKPCYRNLHPYKGNPYRPERCSVDRSRIAMEGLQGPNPDPTASAGYMPPQTCWRLPH